MRDIIAIRESIHEKRAAQRKFAKWETEAAFEIQNFIRQQAVLEDDIIALEVELDRARKDKSRIKKFLAGIGL